MNGWRETPVLRQDDLSRISYNYNPNEVNAHHETLRGNGLESHINEPALGKLDSLIAADDQNMHTPVLGNLEHVPRHQVSVI